MGYVIRAEVICMLSGMAKWDDQMVMEGDEGCVHLLSGGR